MLTTVEAEYKDMTEAVEIGRTFFFFKGAYECNNKPIVSYSANAMTGL